MPILNFPMPAIAGDTYQGYEYDGVKWNKANLTSPTAVYPSQSGNGGKFLTTNGAVVSWATVPPGEKGDRGDKGDTGAQGISVTLQGTKATIADLPAAPVNPADFAGHGWIVTTGDGLTHLDGSLWFWNLTDGEWNDIGQIVGPQGDKGDRGDPGPQGDQGDPGPAGTTDYNELSNTPQNLTDFNNNLTSLVNGAYEVVLDSNSNLTVPGAIVGSGGQLDLRGPSAGESYAYLSLPSDENASSWGARLGNDNGFVDISTMLQGGGSALWRFRPDGRLTFPDNTSQTTAWTGSTISISDTAPLDKEFWFNTDDGRLYVNNSDVWVDASPQIPQETFSGDYDDLINKPTIPSVTADLTPTDVYWDSTDGRAYVRYNGQWVDIAPTVTPQIPTDISDLTDDTGLLSSGGSSFSGDYNDLTNKPSLDRLVNGTKSLILGSSGTLTFPSGATISETVITDNPTVVIRPTSAEAASQALFIKGGILVDYHLHLTTGDLTETSIILGTDDHNVRTSVDGDIEITARDYNQAVSYVWEFNNSGYTHFPNYSFPAADGTNGQVLATDGSGNLSWTTISGGGLSNPLNATLQVIGEGNGITVDAESGQSRVGFMKYFGLETSFVHGNTNPLRFGRVSTANVTNGNVDNFTTEIYIGTTGLVGINNTGPTERLDVTGNIKLSGAVRFGQSGVSTPSLTGTSEGAKIVLYPQAGSNENTETDYAIGIDGDTQWYSVPTAASNYNFKWYGGTTQLMKLTGTGALTLNNSAGGNVLTITGAGRPSNGNIQTWKFYTNTNVGGPGSYIEFPDGTLQITAYNSSTVQGLFSASNASASSSGGSLAYSDGVFTFTPALNIAGNAATVTNGVYTTDTGTVTNTMLAGSIANNKLANSSITINGTSISLGSSSSISKITDGTNTIKIVSAPITLVGTIGDETGNVAFDSNYIYYCKSNYSDKVYNVTSSGGTIASYVNIIKGSYPTPQAGWLITLASTYQFTVTSVTDIGLLYGNQCWRVSWSGSTYSSTGGETFVLTDTTTQIWKRTPWNAITAADLPAPAQPFTFNVAADDSTMRTISSEETIRFAGAGGITIASDTEGKITITQGAAAAGTLTGSTLASGVMHSSLTSLGSLSSVLDINYIGTATTGSVYIHGLNSKGGANYHDFLSVTNESGVAVYPNKYFRLSPTGALEILNSNYDTTIFSLSNAGDLEITGTATVPTLRATGHSIYGTNTYSKSSSAGDIAFDNGTTDTPGVTFYYGNSTNFAIDSNNQSHGPLSGQLLRFGVNFNEAGGALKAAMDTTGNIYTVGFVQAGAWRAGQVIKDVMLSNTELTQIQQGGLNRVATDGNNRDFVTYSYTPLSSSSYIIVHFHLSKYDATGGTGNDSWFSQIKVNATSLYSRDANGVGNGSEISYNWQSTVNGFRTGVLFPITGRYTNSDTNAKTIAISVRRDSADDFIGYDWTATSVWMRITEIAR